MIEPIILEYGYSLDLKVTFGVTMKRSPELWLIAENRRSQLVENKKQSDQFLMLYMPIASVWEVAIRTFGQMTGRKQQDDSFWETCFD